jgi:hypothetical protein
VSPSSQELDVAIAKTTYVIDPSGEIQALRQLLEAVDLKGCECKRMRCMPTALFLLARPTRRGLPHLCQTLSLQRVLAHQEPTYLRLLSPVAHQQTGGETGPAMTWTLLSKPLNWLVEQWPGSATDCRL